MTKEIEIKFSWDRMSVGTFIDGEKKSLDEVLDVLKSKDIKRLILTTGSHNHSITKIYEFGDKMVKIRYSVWTFSGYDELRTYYLDKDIVFADLNKLIERLEKYKVDKDISSLLRYLGEIAQAFG